MVLDRRSGGIQHAMFADISRFLRSGDLLALNNTRVFPARLLGRRVPSGGGVECLLIGRASDVLPGPASHDPPAEEWEALMHPGQKLKPGTRVVFERGGATLHGEVIDRLFFGRRRIRLWAERPFDVTAAIDRIGHIPLPPYIKRDDRESDRERYQTVFARERGSIAAPTAGLHFTPTILDALRADGVETAEITLHVGYGTFKPVRTEDVEAHQVDAERFTVSADAAAALTRAKREGRRIIAVGTTSVRTLESLEVHADGEVLPRAGDTQLFIHPGHAFRLVSGMVTNFHLPKSSLLMLVSALAGREHVLAAYQAAVERRYRFYSYGDAMLIV
jgi:S-adenosylmethionine:tRNA ribosyltransferase-isomerase